MRPADGATTKVRILYFAALRELVGASSEELELPAPSRLSTLLEVLESRHAVLAGRLSAVRCAVDGEIAEPARELGGEVEVALLPPFSGG